MTELEFGFTTAQDMLRKSAREFAESEIRPRVASMDEDGKPPLDLIQKMGELGLTGMLVPKQYGGLGMGLTERAIVLEEIGRVSAAMAMTLQCIHLGQTPIMQFGTPEQKQKFLPFLAKGEVMGCLAITEPSGGSDLLGLQTTAKLEGDRYVLNGRKSYITNAHISKLSVIVAKTGEGSKGLSAFLVDNDAPGFKRGREEDKIGLRGCNTGELIFQSCDVPKDRILGAEGDGFKIAMTTISNIGRTGMAAIGYGVIRACLEEASEYAKHRVLYGKPISELQAIQWKLTDMQMDLETSRLLLYYATWLADKGERSDSENAMAKYWATEAAVRCAKNAIDIFGAYGITRELAPQRLLRDAEVLLTGAGTSEVLRLVMLRIALAPK